jgi:hypothetical protein
MASGVVLVVGLVGLLLALAATARLVRRRRARRLVRLLDSPRYSHAIDLFIHHWDTESAFQQAVEYLVGQGVDPRVARCDLERLIDTVPRAEWTAWDGAGPGTRTTRGAGTSTARPVLGAAAAGRTRHARRPAAGWLGTHRLRLP